MEKRFDNYCFLSRSFSYSSISSRDGQAAWSSAYTKRDFHLYAMCWRLRYHNLLAMIILDGFSVVGNRVTLWLTPSNKAVIRSRLPTHRLNGNGMLTRTEAGALLGRFKYPSPSSLKPASLSSTSSIQIQYQLREKVLPR